MDFAKIKSDLLVLSLQTRLNDLGNQSYCPHFFLGIFEFFEQETIGVRQLKVNRCERKNCAQTRLVQTPNRTLPSWIDSGESMVPMHREMKSLRERHRIDPRGSGVKHPRVLKKNCVDILTLKIRRLCLSIQNERCIVTEQSEQDFDCNPAAAEHADWVWRGQRIAACEKIRMQRFRYLDEFQVEIRVDAVDF